MHTMNAKIFSGLVLAVMLSLVFSLSQVGAQVPEVKVGLQNFTVAEIEF